MLTLFGYFLIPIAFISDIILIILLIKLIKLVLKKDYKKSKAIILFIIGYIILSTSLINYDINQLEKNLEPKCAIKIASLKDGGSAEYIGLGYGIMKYHSLSNKSENGIMINGFNEGYSIKFLYFIEVKEKIKFIPYK